jgi:hypothetical protein
MRVRYRPVTLESEYLEGITADAHEEGFCLRSAAAAHLSVGTHVNLEIEVAGQGFVEGTGEIVNRRSDGCGVRFLRLVPPGSDRLKEAITSRRKEIYATLLEQTQRSLRR